MKALFVLLVATLLTAQVSAKDPVDNTGFSTGHPLVVTDAGVYWLGGFESNETLGIDPATNRCMKQTSGYSSGSYQTKTRDVELAESSVECRFLRASAEIQERTSGCYQPQTTTFSSSFESGAWTYMGQEPVVHNQRNFGARAAIKGKGCFCISAVDSRSEKRGTTTLSTTSAEACADHFTNIADKQTVLSIYRAYRLP